MSEMVKGLGAVRACTPDWFGDLLVGDDAGNRSVDLDDARGMVGIGPQQTELLGGGFQIDLGVVFGVLRDFLSALGNGPVVEQELGAVELDLRQLLVLDGLAIIGERARDVRASAL